LKHRIATFHLLVPLAIIIGFSAFRFATVEQPTTWGFFGHRKINRQAVFLLPPEMMVFFKKNIDFLTEHAVDPDKRRYASPYEAVRHYIDLDVYGEMPFEHVPRGWTDALIQYSDIYFLDKNRDTFQLLIKGANAAIQDSLGELALNPKLSNGGSPKVSYKDFRWFFINSFLPNFYEDNWTAPCDSLGKLLNTTSDHITCEKLLAIDHLSEHGILPWHLQSMLRRLTNAFEEMDANKIRRHAADIGHYIADAHVPLHTTENYNGQLTGQDGIHAFWESRLPELFADEEFDFWTGKAQFIENPKDYFWNIVLESHTLVDSVLAIELDLRHRFPSDQQMCHEMRGGTLVRTQCTAYAAAYNERMGGMVERRMREAILAVGSAWYTAWVLAGQPDINLLEQEIVVVDSGDVGGLEGKKGLFRNWIHE
jgi:hypothetical protein